MLILFGNCIIIITITIIIVLLLLLSLLSCFFGGIRCFREIGT